MQQGATGSSLPLFPLLRAAEGDSRGYDAEGMQLQCAGKGARRFRDSRCPVTLCVSEDEDVS